MLVGPRGMTLAHAAAQHGLIEVTEQLIKHKIPVSKGELAKISVKVCNKLIPWLSDPNGSSKSQVLSDDYGAMPWHTAAEYGNVGAIEAYYNAWHDIMGHFGTINWTILHLAALFNQCEVIIISNIYIPL